MGSSNHIYVSTNNIYITCRINTLTRFYYNGNRESNEYIETDQTLILRISIDNGNFWSDASGLVPDQILNRFSMDEYNNYFRIATTTGHLSKTNEKTSANHVFVLNMDMLIVGELTNIAPGESIYSTRFMGNRCYLVTFKKVDPFFVIDLRNPRSPQILGELKIPGYSDYLHPYDENHVIGIGKDTKEAEEGNFAWYQGVKISLFDVSNVKKPLEISKFNIGDRGTYSDALYDPHAFLFSKEKHLLVIPIHLAEINRSKYPDDIPAYENGEYNWCGAYVFDVTISDGFKLKGRITHEDGTEQPESEDYYYYWYYDKQIKRSFYIEETLYTVSENLIKSNDLNDLSEISAVNLAS